MTFNVLVTGGRDYADYKFEHKVLDAYFRQYGFQLRIINGGARGADQCARNWARDNGVTYITYPARWRAQGNAAGPLRNQRMLDSEAVDLVLVFPGGVGTQDMLKKSLTVDNLAIVDLNGMTIEQVYEIIERDKDPNILKGLTAVKEPPITLSFNGQKLANAGRIDISQFPPQDGFPYDGPQDPEVRRPDY